MVRMSMLCVDPNANNKWREMTSKRSASTSRRRHSWHPTAAELEDKTPAPSQHEQKRRSREQAECTQFLRMKHKLVSKPTDSYAKIRLVHRQDDATRKRSLHRNGNDTINRVESKVSLPAQQTRSAHVRPRTARDSPVKQRDEKATGERVRPQSAKPRHGERDALVAGQQISVALLERTNYYNPIPLTMHLAASRSAPRLQAALKYSTTTRASKSSTTSTPAVPTNSKSSSSSQPTLFTEEKENASGRRHIVVHMQRMVITDDDDDDGGGVEPTIEIETSRVQSGARGRSPRVDSDDRTCFISQRKAWQE